MAQKLNAGMPDSLDLTESWQILFAAVDPTSGADVSGVKVSNAMLVVELVQGDATDLPVGPFMLVPGPGA